MSSFGDGNNLAVFNANIGAEHHFHLFVHGHRSDIRNQNIQKNPSFR